LGVFDGLVANMIIMSCSACTSVLLCLVEAISPDPSHQFPVPATAGFLAACIALVGQ
jgi:hypothetical protein